MNLTTKDYKTILNYYNISHNSISKNWIKRNAEDILANKLCRCIKKVQKQSKLKEPASIAICKNSILKKRNLKSARFSCKKKKKFNKLKGNSNKLKKTKRVIFYYK